MDANPSYADSKDPVANCDLEQNDSDEGISQQTGLPSECPSTSDVARASEGTHLLVQRLLESADRTDNSQSINCPPLTSIVSPTTYEEASEARNAITFAHSSGVPIRPSGIVVTKLRIIFGVEKT